MQQQHSYRSNSTEKGYHVGNVATGDIRVLKLLFD
jgi:hypothetical protein